MYSIAFRRISTLGSRWFGLLLVLLFRTSNASFTCRSENSIKFGGNKRKETQSVLFADYALLTFLKRLLSRSVAAFLRSTVTVFFLQALQAQRRHLRGPWVEVAASNETWG